MSVKDGGVGRARGGLVRAERLSPERKSEIAKTAAQARWSSRGQDKPETAQALEVISYPNKGHAAIELGFDPSTQRIWASQEDIAGIFGVNQSTVSRHIRNVFNDGEVDEKSNMQKVHIANSDKPITTYSLDLMVAPFAAVAWWIFRGE